MRLLVCGDRHWDDYKLVKEEIQLVINNIDIVTCIIEGGAHGADFCAKLAAIELGIPYEEFPADWEKYALKAGPLRNKQMLDEGKPDYVLGFHDDFENSKGTKSMIHLAEKAKVPFWVVKHDSPWEPTGIVHPVTPKRISPLSPPARPAPYTPSNPGPTPEIPRPWKRSGPYWSATDPHSQDLMAKSE